jgi:hypothetical protein
MPARDGAAQRHRHDLEVGHSICGKKGTIIHDAHPWRILGFPLCRSNPELGSARLADHSASRGGAEGSESASPSRHEAEMEGV